MTMSSGWTLEELSDGGHRILRLDRHRGEEVSREELVRLLLQWAQPGDWILWPDGKGTMVVA
jgi:hypothetical protein